jgi:hypothetical protein
VALHRLRFIGQSLLSASLGRSFLTISPGPFKKIKLLRVEMFDSNPPSGQQRLVQVARCTTHGVTPNLTFGITSLNASVNSDTVSSVNTNSQVQVLWTTEPNVPTNAGFMFAFLVGGPPRVEHWHLNDAIEVRGDGSTTTPPNNGICFVARGGTDPVSFLIEIDER